MSGQKTSKNNQLASLRQMAAGLLKHFAGQTLVFSDVTIKVEDLVAKVNTLDAQLTAADAGYTSWKQLLATAKKTQTGLAPTLKALRRYLQGLFGVESSTLLDFGMTPERPPVMTAQTAAAAVLKRAATREARHTMGKKQKAEIHGTVVPAPAAPSPATAPVTPSATGGNKPS